MSTNRCVVQSLSEYIAAIEKYNLFDCISRGEKKEYEAPLRSGIHRKNFKNYSKLLDAYHLDVETAITPVQDKHFLAFAQHHGMPTNLLDFSLSPLVSLYFCTDGCDDKGYVYFINKSRTVNINKVISEKPLGWGLLQDLLNYDLGLYTKILPYMSDAFMANREEMIAYFENHAERFIEEFKRSKSDSYLASLSGGVDDFEKALAKYREDKVRWVSDDEIEDVLTLQIYSSVSAFLRAMQKVYKDDLVYPSSFFKNYDKVSNTSILGADRSANIDVMMFLLKLEEIEYCYNRMFKGKLEFELEFPFYFTYHPPVIDERVKNQSSIFVFQPFSTNTHYFEGIPAQVWQKIVPDFTIEVQNPEAIRRELDAIGINEKHIYCDFDSVAKYTISSIR